MREHLYDLPLPIHITPSITSYVHHTWCTVLYLHFFWIFRNYVYVFFLQDFHFFHSCDFADLDIYFKVGAVRYYFMVDEQETAQVPRWLRSRMDIETSAPIGALK